MKIELELKPWVVPNYVVVKAKTGEQEGNEPSFPLAQVSAEALADLCDLFRKEVFKKAQKQDPERHVSEG